MGIYIKGIKMPEECCECPCIDGEYGLCNILERTISRDGRLPSCPLISLSDHGRLIDVDDGRTTSKAIITKDEIDELPTIEPKRGKWIKIGDCDAVQCSECLDDFDYIDGLCYLCHGQELPNYCPNCGARMDLKGEE